MRRLKIVSKIGNPYNTASGSQDCSDDMHDPVDDLLVPIGQRYRPPIMRAEGEGCLGHHENVLKEEIIFRRIVLVEAGLKGFLNEVDLCKCSLVE